MLWRVRTGTLFFLALAILLLPAWRSSAQPEGNLLRIGFPRPQSGESLTEAQMRGLRDYLLADGELMTALAEEGFTGIGLFPADGGRDVSRRLDAAEFDVAFVPARLWSEEQDDYEIILSTRREGDVTPPRGGPVLQQGVVLISTRSPFFDAQALDTPEFEAYLQQQRLAVVASQSLAGFVAPMLQLARQYGVEIPEGGLLWCDSSEEVVKAVMAGLVDVGACEEGALKETLESVGLAENRDELLRIVLRTAPVPSDPIVVRTSLAPRRSVAGAYLKRAMRTYSLEEGFGAIALQNATGSDYVAVPEIVTEFDERVGEIRR